MPCRVDSRRLGEIPALSCVLQAAGRSAAAIPSRTPPLTRAARPLRIPLRALQTAHRISLQTAHSLIADKNRDICNEIPLQTSHRIEITRAGIEWRSVCHCAVCMAQPCEGTPHHSGRALEHALRLFIEQVVASRCPRRARIHATAAARHGDAHSTWGIRIFCVHSTRILGGRTEIPHSIRKTMPQGPG